MGYVYAVMWFVIAVVLAVRFHKESKMIWGMSGYFIWMGCWWLADQFIEADLMHGTFGWIFRGISVIMIAVLAALYLREKRKKNTKQN